MTPNFPGGFDDEASSSSLHCSSPVSAGRNTTTMFMRSNLVQEVEAGGEGEEQREILAAGIAVNGREAYPGARTTTSLTRDESDFGQKGSLGLGDEGGKRGTEVQACRDPESAASRSGNNDVGELARLSPTIRSLTKPVVSSPDNHPTHAASAIHQPVTGADTASLLPAPAPSEGPSPITQASPGHLYYSSKYPGAPGNAEDGARDVTVTEKVDSGKQGLEMWVAEEGVLRDVGGRQWTEEPGHVEASQQWRTLEAPQKLRPEAVDSQEKLHRISRDNGPSASASKSASSGAKTTRPREESADGSFTGVGSSSAYKRPSLPPGAAPPSLPAPAMLSRRSSQLANDRRYDEEGITVQDDIIGAVTITRNGDRSEYTASDPQLLGRAVSRKGGTIGMTALQGGLSQVSSGDGMILPGGAGRDTSAQMKRGSVGSHILLNTRRPSQDSGLYGVTSGYIPGKEGEETIRGSRSMDPMRNSLPPNVGWGRYPVLQPQTPVGYSDPNAPGPSRDRDSTTFGAPRQYGRTSPVQSRPTPQIQQAPYVGTPLSATRSPAQGPMGFASIQQGQATQQLVPPAEICVECMMRDQDMADVDVTSPGVWARRSDLDFEEVLFMEEAEDRATNMGVGRRGSIGTSAHGSSVEGGGSGTAAETLESQVRAATAAAARVSERGGGSSRESTGPEKTRAGSYVGAMGTRRRKRIGRGQALTQPALRLWTQMNPPASSHRWRTLQTYLQEQAHFLELEQRARIAAQLESEPAEHRQQRSADASLVSVRTSQSDFNARASQGDFSFLNSAPAPIRGRSRQSTILPNGMVMETVDVARDEKEARARAKSRNRSSRTSIPSPISLKSPSPSASMRSYSHGDQPWLADLPRSGATTANPSKRSTLGSGRLGASASELQQVSPRSLSPSRYSVTSRRSAFLEGRPFSIWSRGRRSGSQSVFSFAPSGSMIDMHVGLSQDRHDRNAGVYGTPNGSSASLMMMDQHGNQQQPNLAALGAQPPQGADEAEMEKAKKKAKGFKGFLSKLGIRSRRNSSRSLVEETRAGAATGAPQALQDDEPLAPPPPLSVLAREQRQRGLSQHQRNGSAASLPLRPDTVRTFSAPDRPESCSAKPGSGPPMGSPAMYGSHQGGGIGGSRPPSSYDILAEELADMPSPIAGEGYSADPEQPQFAGLRYVRSKAESMAAPLSLPMGQRSSTIAGQPLVIGRPLRKEKSLPRLPPDFDYPQHSHLGGPPSPTDSYTRKTSGSGGVGYGFPPTNGPRSEPPPPSPGFSPLGFSTRHSNRGSRVLSALVPGRARSASRGSGASPRGSSVGQRASSGMEDGGATGQAEGSGLDYVPSEKTRHAVARSGDFLALRYTMSPTPQAAAGC